MSKPDELFTMPDTEELVRLYADDVYKVCSYYLGRRCQADDAFQDVFVRAIRKRDTFAGNCPVRFWLLTIARNICKDYLKSSWATRVGSYEQMNESGGDLSEGKVVESFESSGRLDVRAQEDLYFDSAEPCGELWDTIMGLPTPVKDVILLRYYYDMNNSEIALHLGISESTVRSRLFRTRKKLIGFTKGTSTDEE